MYSKYSSNMSIPRSLPHLDIAKQFRIGRQEDSHEFARYLVDALQRSCLLGYDRYNLIAMKILRRYLWSRSFFQLGLSHSHSLIL